MKVLICGASPDRINNNAILRNYVANGFREILGDEQVSCGSLDIASELAELFRPDLIVVFGSCMPESCDYSKLRNYCSSSCTALAFWLHDDPYEFDLNFKIYNYADYIFSNDKWAVEHINHKNVHHLPLAADRESHFLDVSTSLDREVFFCGVGFPNRVQFLLDSQDHLSSFNVNILGAEWPDSLVSAKNIRVPNDSMSKLYNKSLITLNLGRRHNLANRKYQLDSSTPGPRTFEAAMAGSVQCYYVEGLEIAQYYHPQSEILLFDSPIELKNIVEELRDDPSKRKIIAQNSQARTLKDHTYANRAKSMLLYINNHNG
ncbi:CgeB family protein [Rhodococcus sp. IEGM1300]